MADHSTIAVILFVAAAAAAQNPAERWHKYATPEEAGWSSARLAEVRPARAPAYFVASPR